MITIIVNVLFFMSVAITIITQRDKLTFSEIQSSEEQSLETQADDNRKIKKLIFCIVVPWVMFNIAAFQFRRISSSDDVISVVSLILIVILNIGFLIGFVFVALKKSNLLIISTTIAWILSNIFVKFIAFVVVAIIATIVILIMLSGDNGGGNSGSWFRSVSRRKQVPDPGYDPRTHDSKGNKLD